MFVRSWKHSKPLPQTLIDGIRTVVFAKIEMDYQDNSTLLGFLPHLVNQVTKFSVEDKSLFFRNEQFASIKKPAIDALRGK